MAILATADSLAVVKLLEVSRVDVDVNVKLGIFGHIGYLEYFMANPLFVGMSAM